MIFEFVSLKLIGPKYLKHLLISEIFLCMYSALERSTCEKCAGMPTSFPVIKQKIASLEPTQSNGESLERATKGN